VQGGEWKSWFALPAKRLSVAPEGQLDIEKTLGNQQPDGISAIIKKYFKHNQSKHFR